MGSKIVLAAAGRDQGLDQVSRRALRHSLNPLPQLTNIYKHSNFKRYKMKNTTKRMYVLLILLV